MRKNHVQGRVQEFILLLLPLNHMVCLSLFYPSRGIRLITARVRSTTGGYIFSLFTPGGGYHPSQGGVPSFLGRRWGYHPSCYAAGGMPVAFTQEDFLVQ